MFNWFKKYKDDGIKFQWGERYICSDEIVPELGGKYWRKNEDGTITRFNPAALEFKAITFIVVCLIRDKIEDDNIKKITSKEIYKLIKVDKTNYTIAFKESNLAELIFNHFKDRKYWTAGGVTFKFENLTLHCNIAYDLNEETYTPEHGPDYKNPD